VGRAKADLIAVIEAAYMVEERDPSLWIRRLVERSQPALDGGMGVVGYLADLGSRDEEYCSTPVAVGCPEGWADAFRAITGSTPIPVRRRMATGSPVLTLSTQVGAKYILEGRPIFREVAEKIGMRDWLGIKAFDPSGHGLIITAPLPEVSTAPANLVRTWSRVAAHIAAGYRLMRRMSANDEAIIDTRTEKVVHAEGEARSLDARELLSDAARTIDRARGKMRKASPEEAVSIWLGLVAGKWSLVERVDSDGQRHLLARRNVEGGSAPALLSEPERQALAYTALGHDRALVAYELGLDEATIDALLSSVQVKLNAPSIEQLLELHRAAFEAS
jgi:DNA-binding CsgD family transcriptional regulator